MTGFGATILSETNAAVPIRRDVPDMKAIEAMLIGSSAAMVQLRRLIVQVARSKASVLVTGPSGTGKEVVARCLHMASPRAGASFVAVNCGAIPRELLESELFGHEKGSFTGALQARKGRFEAADNGSIFLDEIGDMPADMQVKLLRVLEERQIERVGSNRTQNIDVRVISATHRNLEEAIRNGSFREDLFYRLNIFPLRVPALAERRDDIPELIAHFLKQMGADTRFSAEALMVLKLHDWPGNVRELRNVVERATILFPDETVDVDFVHLLLNSRAGAAAPIPVAVEQNAVWEAATTPQIAPEIENEAVVTPLRPTGFGIDPHALVGTGACDMRGLVAHLEQSLIRAALDSNKDVIADAARSLGLQRTSLIEKMRKYDIGRSTERSQVAA